MAEETQYTGKLKAAQIATANSNRDGTGTLGTLTTGGVGGSIIKRVFIKALVNTTHGAIRFFVSNAGGSAIRLIKEVNVPPVTKSAISPSFEAWVDFGFLLQEGFILKASTQNAETFDLTAEALDFAYYNFGVREDTTQFAANNGTVSISTANSNLDGTGTLGTIYTAGASPTYTGSSIETITVKATGTTSAGMVRLYMSNGIATAIFTEIPVPTVTPSGTDQAFEHTLVFEDNLDLQTGFIIKASTENAETFIITVEGKDWNYAS